MGSRTARVFCVAGLLAAFAGRLALAADGVAGEWSIRLEVAGQAVEYSLELTQAGDKVRGDLVSPRTKNRYPIEDGSFKDSTLKFKVPEKGAEVVAKLAGDKLEGTFDSAVGNGKFIGQSKSPPPKDAPGKKSSLSGKWKTLAKLPDDREVGGALQVADKGGKLSGTVSGDQGSLELKSIVLSESGKTAISFILPTNAGDLEIAIEAAFDGPDRLKGRWSLADNSASGDWSAQREVPPPAAVKAALGERYRFEAKISENEKLIGDFRPRMADGKLAGAITLEGGGKLDVQGSFQDGKIEMELDVPYKNQTKKVKISGAVGEKGVLQGSWKADDGSGDWVGRPVVEI